MTTSRTRTAVAVAAVAAGVALLGGCGGGGTKVASSTTTTAPGADAKTPAVKQAGVSTTTSTPANTVAAGAGNPLPVGAATGFPFGTTTDSSDGTPNQISLLPPNAGDVDQAAVAAAPRLGPFAISAAAGPSGWPDACTLTNLAQLKALEPSITGLSGAPVGTKAQQLGSGGNTPNNTDCKFNLTTSFDPQGYSGVPSWVDVSFQQIDPDSATEYQQNQQQQASQAAQYPAQYANYPSLPNGVTCFDDGNELQCLKGSIYFYVNGQKVTGGPNSGADNAVWIDQIELPLAEVLGAEMQST